MDKIDCHILTLLQQNARLSVSDISSIIHMSVPAIRERIKKIEASGIILQYTAILNPSVMKKELSALMFISLEKPQFTDKFCENINKMDEILECNYIAGDYDYLLKILTENTNSLEHLLTKIKSIPGVQKTCTYVVLCNVKNKFSFSPPID
jgi:Lrp/AsnC family leucine-responsive transcriptional regulator